MAMTLKDTLAHLKSLGDEKVRAHNKKYGAGDNQFGVKLGDIRKIAAKIKSNDPLALALWDTGNIDAQLLAILLMNPKSLSRDAMDRTVRSVNFVHVADWLSSMSSRTIPTRSLFANHGWRMMTPGRPAPDGV